MSRALQTNFFPLTISQSTFPGIFQYDIQYAKDFGECVVDQAESSRAFEHFCTRLVEDHPNLARFPETLVIDYSPNKSVPVRTCYSAVDIGDAPIALSVTFRTTVKQKNRRAPPQDTSLSVKITRINRITTEDRFCMKHFLNVVLRRALDELRYLGIKGGYYMLDKCDTRTVRLARGEYSICWLSGFKATTAFLNGSFGLQVLPESTRYQRRTVADIVRNNSRDARIVRNLTIFTPYNQKMFKVFDCDFKVTPRSPMSEHTTRTHAEYFREQYGEELPQLFNKLLGKSDILSDVARDGFMVKAVPVDKVKNGKARRSCLLPPSLCIVMTDPEMRADDPQARSALATTSVAREMRDMPPERVIARASQLVAELQAQESISQMLSDYHIDLAKDAAAIEGKLAAAPTLVVDLDKRDIPITPDMQGSFRTQFTSLPPAATKIYRLEGGKPATGLKTWAIVMPKYQKDIARKFSGDVLGIVSRLCGQQGAEVERPAVIAVDLDPQGWRADPYYEAIDGYIARIAKDQQQTTEQAYAAVQLLIIMLPGSKTTNCGLYRDVKVYCTNKRIVTQCILEPRHGRDYAPEVMYGLCQQSYSKAGGAVWYPRLGPANAFGEGTMLCAYDVSRPQILEKRAGRISSSGFVSTYNRSFEFTLSQTKQILPRASANNAGEVHDNTTISQYLHNSLEAYRAFNKAQLPARIVIYRDGVSDGQLSDVKRDEISAVVALLRSVYAAADQTFTMYFVVSQKSSSIRFADTGGPLQPGTYFLNGEEFIMASQAVAPTTCPKPLRYKVVRACDNEKDLPCEPSQDLIDLTYAMTYGYVNWTQSISAPHVLHLAHLLSKFSNEVLQGQFMTGDNPQPFGLQYRPFFI